MFVTGKYGGPSTIGSITYNFNKLFNLGFTDLCNKKAYSAKLAMSPLSTNLASITGIWVQSAVIAVLTIFCALVLVASLLAEELDNRTKEETFIPSLSAALDDWLTQFHQLNVLVERIQDVFSQILAFTLFQVFVQFPYQIDIFIGKILNPAYSPLLSQIISNIMMNFIQLSTIVFVCQQLQNKVQFITNLM